MNKNNNNTIKYPSTLNEALESRMCWFSGCECKSRLATIGKQRKNGKDFKKNNGNDYNARRFHKCCNSTFNSRVYYEREYQERKLHENPDYESPVKFTYQLENLYIKPEFRPFNKQFNDIKYSKRYKKNY